LGLVVALTATPSVLVPQANVALLFTGEFLGQHAWPASGETWFALYSTPAGYRLATTTIRVESVPNACAGTATKVSVDGPLQPFFLLRGLQNLRAGPIDTAFAGRTFLYPGQSFSARLGEAGKWYYFRALGTAGTHGLGETLITNYRLELRDSGRMGAPSQIIARLDRLALDSPPQLRWSGDLDQDGRLDVLLQLPGAYVLLVSSRATPPDLVAQAATFPIVIC
jgi:hypothetical protein